MKKLHLFLLTAFLTLFSGLASADLPAGIATGLSAVQADATDLFDLVWPVVITIFGGMVLFKLFKRAGAKI